MSTPGARGKILFLSGVDFKEKSIQVITKTPEAYVRAGWEVYYVVGRDKSTLGDYFYEKPINPIGVNVYRFNIPLSQVHGLINSSYWKAFWFRVRNVILVSILVIKGIQLIRKHSFDILYGYEIPGVLAGRVIKALGFSKPSKFITRFQGVLYVKEWLRRNQKFRTISNFEAIAALRSKADLCIMTNDGSQGVEVLKKLNSRVKQTVFLTNGVDEKTLDPELLEEVGRKYYSGNKCRIISVSRLDGHKRIDRGIKIVNKLVHSLNFKEVEYTIIGGGSEFNKLSQLIHQFKLNEYVRLLGALPHKEVQYHYYYADFFISMYTSTNVGNPLLEAIRNNIIVLTLNNGDTGEWLQQKVNGLIYNVNDEEDLSESDYEQMATDLVEVYSNESLKQELKTKLKETERKKLWTWSERMSAELTAIESLFK